MVRPSLIFEEIALQPGASIFAQGSPAQVFYLVVQGSVECWPGPLDGKQPRVAIREGMIVGEGGLMHPIPYPFSAAAGPAGCRLVQVPHTVIQPKLERSDPMIVTVIRMLMEYTKNTNRRVVDLIDTLRSLESEASTLDSEIRQWQQTLPQNKAKLAELQAENLQLRGIVEEHIRKSRKQSS